jgi:hypothetical protein
VNKTCELNKEYLYLSYTKTKYLEIMKNTELNIGKAILTSKESLTKMIAQGFTDAKHIFALSNMLMKNFNLNQEQATEVIEESLKLC